MNEFLGYKMFWITKDKRWLKECYGQVNTVGKIGITNTERERGVCVHGCVHTYVYMCMCITYCVSMVNGFMIDSKSV